MDWALLLSEGVECLLAEARSSDVSRRFEYHSLPFSDFPHPLLVFLPPSSSPQPPLPSRPGRRCRQWTQATPRPPPPPSPPRTISSMSLKYTSVVRSSDYNGVFAITHPRTLQPCASFKFSSSYLTHALTASFLLFRCRSSLGLDYQPRQRVSLRKRVSFSLASRFSPFPRFGGLAGPPSNWRIFSAGTSF